MQRRSFVAGLVATGVLFRAAAPSFAQTDPLPSWNDGPAKRSIIDFVTRVTTAGSGDFVAAPERIATFDNDGTLWTEQPVYFQVAFAFDQVKKLAPQHPEWTTLDPFKSVLAGDMVGLAQTGEKGLLEIIAATHTGLTTEDFTKAVNEWLATARQPRFKRPYTDLVYQPMLELLAYMRANQFKTFIVSGGGIEFMRPWTERIYGIPPEQVVGSSGVTKYVMQPRRRAGPDEGAEGRVHRRRAGQAGRHQPFHRPAAGLRLRQLRWRPADAGMDGGGSGRALHGPRSSYRRRCANTPTTGSRTSASSTRRGTRRCGASGSSST